MRRWLFLVVAIGFTLFVQGRAIPDSLRISLARAIAKAPYYDSAKNRLIDSLRGQLEHIPAADFETAYHLRKAMYEAYRIFKYDSAFRYARTLQVMAYDKGDPLLIKDAKLKMSFILLSSGLYKETYDSLSSVDIRNTPAELKAAYYTLMGRYYYDIAGYDNDAYHSDAYDIRGSAYMDSALMYYPAGSFESVYYSGLKYFKSYKTAEALPYFQRLIVSHALTDHQYALVSSTMSGILLQNKQTEAAIELLSRAAEADIRTSTKETFAIFTLAALLFKQGDVKNASVYIEAAIEDAAFYGARQRKVQMSALLPLIEGERINSVEAQRNTLIKYASLVTALGILLVGLTIVVLKQVKRIKKSQELISAAHARQQEINGKLEIANHSLAEVNEKLEEVNKIKEEYIGYFFNMDSEFFTRLEKLKKTLEQKLNERKYDDIRFIVNNIDSKKEKEDLLTNFDKVFLKLFPNFIPVFNGLFPPDDHIRVTENSLTTEHRIYALIRMGITDSEKIAQILDYSVKTIYAYKTRIKNRSIDPKHFEERLMETKTM